VSALPISISDLKARIDALGRPGFTFTTMGTVGRSLAAAREWDAKNPEKAAQYRVLVDQLEAAERDAERQAAQVRALERIERRIESSGLAERTLEAARAPGDTEAMALTARWLADHSRTWLVMCGNTGIGKSVAAAWAALQVAKGGGSIARTRASELASLSQFDAGAAEMARFKRVDLLVVDDFGTELLNDFARARIFELFDERHETYGRTIITSNLSWLPTTRNGETTPGLEQRLGARLVDRIRQAGTVQQLGGKSLRGPR
jgi:DNA replication protein DnaC